MRRSVLDDVGLLDAGYFLYWEEIDWCLRIAKAGWEGWYVGTAEVVHLVGPEALQVVLYSLIYLRNSWPFRDRTKLKARRAAASIRQILSRTKHTLPS